jgi:hypothetical protein
MLAHLGDCLACIGQQQSTDDLLIAEPTLAHDPSILASEASPHPSI